MIPAAAELVLQIRESKFLIVILQEVIIIVIQIASHDTMSSVYYFDGHQCTSKLASLLTVHDIEFL